MRGKTQSLKKHRRQKRVKMISGEKTANEQKTPISLSSSICLLLLEIKQINVEISEPDSQRKKNYSPFFPLYEPRRKLNATALNPEMKSFV